MQRIFHWAVVGVLIVIGIWSIGAYGELFRAHIRFFIFLWFFLPVVALWTRTKQVRSSVSVSGLKTLRNALMSVSVVISFASFAHFEQIRDAVGHAVVEGYYVTYYEDTDDSSRPYRGSELHTAHWYSRAGLWLFEWLFLGACVGLPSITWVGANGAVKKTIEEDNEETA